MNITDIKIRKKENYGNLKAVVSLILDDGNLAVNDIRVMQNQQRLSGYIYSFLASKAVEIFLPHLINRHERKLKIAS